MRTKWLIEPIMTWKARARMLLAAGTSSASHLDLAPISHRTSALGQWATALCSRASKDSLRDVRRRWWTGKKWKKQRQTLRKREKKRLRYAFTWCRGFSQSRRRWARRSFYWGTPAGRARRWHVHTPGRRGQHTETQAAAIAHFNMGSNIWTTSKITRHTQWPSWLFVRVQNNVVILNSYFNFLK